MDSFARSPLESSVSGVRQEYLKPALYVTLICCCVIGLFPWQAGTKTAAGVDMASTVDLILQSPGNWVTNF